MSTKDKAPLLRVWQLLYGFAATHLQTLFLSHFQQSFNAPWTDSDANRDQFRARSRKFSKSKLLQTDALSDRFEGQNCVDWDLSLLCAALECLLTGQQLENALMGVLAVRDELTNASARTATIAKAKKMEDKLKSFLCTLGANAIDFDQCANMYLTREMALALEIEPAVHNYCQSLIMSLERTPDDDPQGVAELCAKGLMFAGLIEPEMEAMFYKLRAGARVGCGEPFSAYLEDTALGQSIYAESRSSWDLAHGWLQEGDLAEACRELQRCLALRNGNCPTTLATLQQWQKLLLTANCTDASRQAFSAVADIGCLRFNSNRACLYVDKSKLPPRPQPGELERLPKARACARRGIEALRDEEFAKSRSFFERAANLNDVQGMQYLALMAMYGCGGPKSIEMAAQLAERSITRPKNNDPECGWREAAVQALALLSMMYRYGIHYKRDVTKAVYYSQCAVDLNGNRECHMLGVSMLEAINYDLRGARDHLHLAAQYGAMEACFDAGTLYIEAMPNRARAELWFRAAHQAGFRWPIMEMVFDHPSTVFASASAAVRRHRPLDVPTLAPMSSADKAAMKRDAAEIQRDKQRRGYQRHWVPSIDEVRQLPTTPASSLWLKAKQLAVDLYAQNAGDADTRQRALEVVLHEDAWLVLTHAEFTCIYLVAKMCCLNDNSGGDDSVIVHPEHHAAVFVASLDRYALDEQIVKVRALQAQHTVDNGTPSIVLLQRLGQLLRQKQDAENVADAMAAFARALELMLTLKNPTHPLMAWPFRPVYQQSLCSAMSQMFSARGWLGRDELLSQQNIATQLVELGNGSRHLTTAHMTLFQIDLLLERRGALAHLRRAIAAENALPAFLRGVASSQPAFAALEAFGDVIDLLHPSAFGGRPHPGGSGGALLCMKGVDARLLSGYMAGLKTLRRQLAGELAQDGGSVRMEDTDPKPAVVRPKASTKDSSALHITIDELVARGVDQVMLGRMLRVMVVSEAVFRHGWAIYLVLDGENSVLRMCLSGFGAEALSQLLVGMVLNILSPYYHIGDLNTPCILVQLGECPPLYFVKHRAVCWACLQQKQLKRCARCQRAEYCSAACQKESWVHHEHKLWCNT